MHLHILGVCGTFMGGIAAIAKQAGHTVSGCDANVYPPMSTQLAAQGIELIEGFGANQIELNPDVYVIGNVVTRGNSLMEEILNRGLPYTSGPQWLRENVLRGQWTLAVAGTHGKTTTSAMLAWILERAGLEPGFLIGGVPQNFELSARLGPPLPQGEGWGEGGLREGAPDSVPAERGVREGAGVAALGRASGALATAPANGPSANESQPRFFVVEADEYDTAFFDKRSKFLHYQPRTTILNNLEFDHADIFADLAAIETQFHHLVRTLPGNGLVVANGSDQALARVLKKGCWTPVERFGTDQGWQARANADGTSFEVLYQGEFQGSVEWDLLGQHNRLNALAAIAAARHAGVPVKTAVAALAEFKSVKRRMEVRGVVNDITLYDDFAHHPTAIEWTLQGLRRKVGQARILAVLEPRSNTMKMGVMKEALAPSLNAADQVFCYTKDLGWDANAVLKPLRAKALSADDIDALASAVAAAARPGDHVLVMSNGGFGGIHDKIIAGLQGRFAHTT